MSFSKEFIAIMDYIGSKLGIAIDWTSQNMLPYFTELIERVVKYEVASSIVWIIMWILFILSCFIASAIFKKKRIHIDARIGFNIFTIFVLAIGILVISNQVFDIIEAFTIPEMTFYSYIKHISYNFQ